ncbi:MAG TPA: hypothetical protein VNO19_08930 [Gemmatimonadales bacterium]|nr:hypothetical protein [Gemmatimonadales bacterium]
MRMVTLSIPVVLALCLGAANLSAQQQPGNGTFQWYVGGHGGILNFATSAQGRSTIPLGGAHLLVTARRTGLLLSVEQGFGSNEPGVFTAQAIDSVGNLTSEGQVAATFDYVRKYSAMLMAFPIRGPATPYFGVGVGIMHTGGNTPDDDLTAQMGSSGFGSLLGGLNFRVSRLSAFGQYEVTTSPGTRRASATFSNGSKIQTFGSLLRGPTHTFTAGLRFGLGNAKERSIGGGY